MSKAQAAEQTQPQLLEAEPTATERPSRKRGLQKVDPPTSTAMAPAGSPAPAPTDMEVFARIAADPNVDLAKLERLIALKEHMLSGSAKAAFDADFAEMQGDLPEIDERGRIVVEGQLRSNYAKNEDIQKFIRPVLKKYGFALSFREGRTEDGKMSIVGILSHRGGHREEDRFITTPDDSGKKNAIQARGSSRSYGQRYTTIFLLNISTREPGFADDDGQGSERAEAPKGYDDFLADVEAVAVEGMAGVADAWKNAKDEFRAFAQKYDRNRWSNLRAKAKKVDQSREEVTS